MSLEQVHLFSDALDVLVKVRRRNINVGTARAELNRFITRHSHGEPKIRNIAPVPFAFFQGLAFPVCRLGLGRHVPVNLVWYGGVILVQTQGGLELAESLEKLRIHQTNILGEGLYEG